MTTNVPSVTLNNAVELPILGFGVDQIPGDPFFLADDEMARITTMDTGASLFFDHRDPAMRQPAQRSTRPVTGLGNHR